MPRKKTDLPTPPDQDARLTAPTVPANLVKEIKMSPPAADESAAQRITVRKTAAAVPKPPETASASVPPPPDTINNAETDKAVDDIMAKESDMVLAVDDMIRDRRSQTPTSSGWKDKLRALIHNKWTWVGVAIILCFIFALPFTRYKVLGLLIKEKVDITVIDSQNHTPVSNALVSLDGTQIKTDANGVAIVKAGVGERSAVISKRYYQTATAHYFVGFKSGPPLTIKLVATGRLVPITVLNAIGGKAVPGATIHVLDTTAKTNSKGQANVALPAGAANDTATISLTGYNTKKVSVQVTALSIAANDFTLTPAGTIDFLSNQGGTINVLKSNLDGTNIQTVLAGTGHETAATTRLLASSDWHYVVLEANRDGTRPALYLINTSNNQVTEFDSSNATFNLIGWSGHDFVYSLSSNSVSPWQNGSQLVKAYNADQGQINQLDQNQAAGDNGSYGYQNFANFFLSDGTVVYSTQWIAQGGYDLSSSNDTIRTYQLGAQTLKNYEALPASTTGTIVANRDQPQVIYFAAPDINGNPTSYYEYDNQNVQTANINQTIFNQTNPAYLLSPSGSHSLWSELSNGQDLFLVGNSNAGAQQQIAALDGYTPYGWYSDNYVLASRDNDQLYILPASGLSGNQQSLKITNYYEPAGKTTGYEYSGL
jgi:hypothetical protein